MSNVVDLEVFRQQQRGHFVFGPSYSYVVSPSAHVVEIHATTLLEAAAHLRTLATYADVRGDILVKLVPAPPSPRAPRRPEPSLVVSNPSVSLWARLTGYVRRWGSRLRLVRPQ